MASTATVPATTLANLQTAYEGESNARAKYIAFAARAVEEGFMDVASLFRAAARAEQIHAGNHARVIRNFGVDPKCTIHEITVGSTAENLATAIAGEEYERGWRPRANRPARNPKGPREAAHFAGSLEVREIVPSSCIGSSRKPLRLNRLLDSTLSPSRRFARSVRQAFIVHEESVSYERPIPPH